MSEERLQRLREQRAAEVDRIMESGPSYNFYRALNVSPDATSKELWRAFKTISAAMGPCKGAENFGDDRDQCADFLVDFGYTECLMDSRTRKQYDADLKKGNADVWWREHFADIQKRCRAVRERIAERDRWVEESRRSKLDTLLDLQRLTRRRSI